MGQIALKWTGDDSHLFVGRDTRGGTVVAGTWPRADDEAGLDWRGAKPSDLLVVSLCRLLGLRRRGHPEETAPGVEPA